MALAGVPERLELLYRADGDRLWRAIFAFTRDRDTASDAVAEAFAQALRRGQALRDPQAWIWRTAFRLAAGEMQLRRQHLDEPAPEAAYLDPTVDHTLLDALAQLPAPQRTAVILFYYTDLPVREIAARTGRSSLAIRAHLSRGRKRLRSLLGGDDA